MRLATIMLRTLAAAAIIGTATGAMAQSYPTKPITLIVPWPAGGSTDVAMRALAEGASKHLGQPIVIDNKAGRVRYARPGDHGGNSEARRLHHRADADHRHAPAADAEGELRRRQGASPISST